MKMLPFLNSTITQAKLPSRPIQPATSQVKPEVHFEGLGAGLASLVAPLALLGVPAEAQTPNRYSDVIPGQGRITTVTSANQFSDIDLTYQNVFDLQENPLISPDTQRAVNDALIAFNRDLKGQIVILNVPDIDLSQFKGTMQEACTQIFDSIQIGGQNRGDRDIHDGLLVLSNKKNILHEESNRTFACPGEDVQHLFTSDLVNRLFRDHASKPFEKARQLAKEDPNNVEEIQKYTEEGIINFSNALSEELEQNQGQIGAAKQQVSEAQKEAGNKALMTVLILASLLGVGTIGGTALYRYGKEQFKNRDIVRDAFTESESGKEVKFYNYANLSTLQALWTDIDKSASKIDDPDVINAGLETAFKNTKAHKQVFLQDTQYLPARLKGLQIINQHAKYPRDAWMLDNLIEIAGKMKNAEPGDSNEKVTVQIEITLADLAAKFSTSASLTTFRNLFNGTDDAQKAMAVNVIGKENLFEHGRDVELFFKQLEKNNSPSVKALLISRLGQRARPQEEKKYYRKYLQYSENRATQQAAIEGYETMASPEYFSLLWEQLLKDPYPNLIDDFDEAVEASLNKAAPTKQVQTLLTGLTLAKPNLGIDEVALNNLKRLNSPESVEPLIAYLNGRGQQNTDLANTAVQTVANASQLSQRQVLLDALKAHDSSAFTRAAVAGAFTRFEDVQFLVPSFNALEKEADQKAQAALHQAVVASADKTSQKELEDRLTESNSVPVLLASVEAIDKKLADAEVIKVFESGLSDGSATKNESVRKAMTTAYVNTGSQDQFAEQMLEAAAKTNHRHLATAGTLASLNNINRWKSAGSDMGRTNYAFLYLAARGTLGNKVTKEQAQAARKVLVNRVKSIYSSGTNYSEARDIRQLTHGIDNKLSEQADSAYRKAKSRYDEARKESSSGSSSGGRSGSGRSGSGGGGG